MPFFLLGFWECLFSTNLPANNPQSLPLMAIRIAFRAREVLHRHHTFLNLIPPEEHMRSTRSQISMFLVLGIVLLVLVGSLVGIGSLLSKKQGETAIQQSIEQPKGIAAIEDSVESCLSKVFSDAVLLAGKQGGAIYRGELVDDSGAITFPDQGGAIEITVAAKDKADAVKVTEGEGDAARDFYVWKAIRKPSFSANAATCAGGDGCTSCPEEAQDPDCAGFSCSDTIDGMCVHDCVPVDVDYGDTSNLHFYDGENTNINDGEYPWVCFPYDVARQQTSGTLTSNCDSSSDLSSTGAYGRTSLLPLTGPQSVAASIEAYINTNVVRCVAAQSFEGHGYRVTPGQAKATLSFGEGDTSVSLDFPLQLQNLKTGEKSKLSGFAASIAADVKKMHALAKYLADKDNGDIGFDLVYVSLGEDAPARDGVTIVKGDGTPAYDLFTLTDTSSRILGTAFTLRFARENRRPALNYFFDEAMYSDISAVDPDEDSPIITFGGDVCVVNSGIKSCTVKATDAQEDIFDVRNDVHVNFGP